MQPVGRGHEFRPGVLEQLELMMEMVDRSDALPLGPAPQRARYQDGDPQYDYEY
jgi:hypothetical protein